MSKEWEPENVFDLFGSEYARQILALASKEPMSAQELADHTDASLPTTYRRVDALQEYDLLRASTQVDPDGNHYRTFETDLERVCFGVEDGSFTVDIQLQRDVVDRFGEFWGDLEGGEDE